jgi:hypothetical protein
MALPEVFIPLPNAKTPDYRRGRSCPEQESNLHYLAITRF